jgi:hypothetical protein
MSSDNIIKKIGLKISTSYFYTSLLLILVFVIGFCLGATDYHESLKGVNWANILSPVVSLLGFSFAIVTYNQWLNKKKQDDAYLVAKEYLSALNKIEDALIAINFQYSYLCPVPGLAVEPREISIKRIEEIDNLRNSFYSGQVDINKYKRELIFWKVKLNDIYEEKHNYLNQHLRDINSIMFCLNSQLCGYYVERRENIQEVIRHKEMFDEHLKIVQAILYERFSQGFENMFKFE